MTLKSCNWAAPGRRKRTAGVARGLRVFAGALVALGLLATAVPEPAPAQDLQPLLIEDTQSLFQRVLTRPGATLRAEPSAEAEVVNEAVPTFTVYYVFDRHTVDDVEWAQIGGPFNGPAEGWVPVTEVIDWRQTMVVAFSLNRANRERVLFFDERPPLIELLESELLVPQSRELREMAVDGSLPADSPIISIEPETPPDLTEEFYLLPILEAEDVYLASGYDTRILRVASIPLHEGSPDAREGLSYEEALAQFEVGIVFVIDTTTSMGPFIEAVQRAVERVHANIAGSEIADRVSFSLVGFRDNTQLRPELQYISEVFVPLESGQPTDVFLDAISLMTPAEISSVGFNEDSMAGLQEAINLEGWSKHDFGGRYVILITDAGPRQSSDPNSTTGMAPAQINSAAAASGIAVYSLHLLSDEGEFDHEYAGAAYRAVSAYPGLEEPLYFPVEGGNVEVFENQVDLLTEQLISQVEQTIQGQIAEVVEEAETELERQVALVGRAMQMAYLGRVTGSQAPPVFEAWAADIDFSNPRLKSLQVRVLLTKNQLSDLTQVLQTILDIGEANQLEPDEFFGRLRSAVAHLSRDPNMLPNAEFESLGELIGEYLEGLPYQSRIMEIDEQAWNSMGPGGQLETLDSIRSKLELYQQYDRNPDLWQPLYDGAPPGEHVFPVPLNDLP